MPHLRLYFLGAPRVEHEGALIPLSVAKAFALLAYLALQEEPQPREKILSLLWAESRGDTARKNLRNLLWTLRKVLGDDTVQGEDERLALDAAVWVDAREFEKISASRLQSAGTEGNQQDGSEINNLQSALSLYHGDFLEGLTIADAPDFEIWLTTERERLAQLHLRALAALIDEYRAVNNWQSVIATAQRALSFDNLQEPTYRALIEAHAQLGERGQALHQYDVLRATLQRELGVAPLPETEILRARILEAAPLPRPTRESSGKSARAPRSSIPKDLPRVPFVGREEERAALDEELRASERGQARVVVLTGEVGIGKSRLWQEWSRALPSQVHMIETRCLEASQALPFAPLTELFSRREIGKRLFTSESPVSSIWLTEVARLLPEIRAKVPNLPAPANVPADEERARVFEALTQCILAISNPAKSLILFMDDAHWADRATLDLLDYFFHTVNDGHRVNEHSLMLVVAYRREDAPPALIHLVASWGRERFVRRVPLARLTPQETALLTAALAAAPTVAERVQTLSAGNPYYLIELIRAASTLLQEAELVLPPELTGLIRARLDKLPDAARQALQAAAVLEPDFEFVTLRRTSGRAEEETLDALDALLNAAILTERNDEYGFSHPLIATVVRAGLSGARRSFLHRRAAGALEAAHAGRLPVMAGHLAAHYAEANDPSRAAHYFTMAAERAISLGAMDEAIASYRRAIALEPTPARRVALAIALAPQSGPATVHAELQAALDEFVAQGDAQGAARTCLAFARMMQGGGRADDVVKWVERCYTFLAHDADPELHARAHFLLGSARRQTEESLAEAEENLNEAAQLASTNGLLGLAANVRFELGNLLAERGDLAGAIAAFEDSIALGEASSDPFQIVLGHNNAGYHALLAGDLESARQHVDAGIELAEANALRFPRQYLYSTRGEIALAENRWDEAEEWFGRGLLEAERAGSAIQAANYRANLALTARGRGDLDNALLFLERARAEAAKLPAPHLQAQIDLWLTEVHLARRERTAAREALLRTDKLLAHGDRGRLKEWAKRLREELAGEYKTPNL